MNEKNSAPLSLKVIAWIFILSGVSSIVSILLALVNNKIHIDLGVIGLFIGAGLLKGSTLWRNLALVATVLSCVFIPIAIIFFFFSNNPTYFKILGQRVGQVPSGIAIIFGIQILVFSFWQYHVLNRRDVLRFFGIVDDHDKM